MNTQDLKKALEKLSLNASKYAVYDRYYAGEHDLAFASKKYQNAFGQLFREFALNLCNAVCDAPKDKLKVIDFSAEKGAGAVQKEAWRIWQQNRMGIRSGEVHKEALRMGDAYAIVWTNPDGEVTIYPNKATACTIEYDPETPGKALWAAKYWAQGDLRIRLNLYYPDRIEKYITRQKQENGLPGDPAEFEPIASAGGDSPIVENEFGTVPVFHFSNNSEVGAFGVSELRDAIPVQNALNKSVADMLVAMEFSAYRQRYATGIEVEYDENNNPKAPFAAGIERLWVTENPDVKFGDFEQTDLKQFLDVKDSFRMDMACVTGTPLYYFMQVGANFPSGEALKKSETRFINKVLDRQENFGQVWADVMEFALKLENKGQDARIFTKWAEAAPATEKETLENIILKKELGIDDKQALIEAGYGEDDIDRIMEAKEMEKEAEAGRFNGG